MVVIVDYGMGNLRSVQKGFEKVGASAVVTRDPRVIREAERLVLPGVGAFPECMRNLSGFGLVEPVLDVIRSGRPFLGICLGLQLLFDESEEFGLHEGLKVFLGKVRAFDRSMGLKIPHMGWNRVFFSKESPIWSGIENGSFLYFVHSYYVDPTNRADVAAETEYGRRFACAVQRDNIVAVQFHPEKSQEIGLRILKNFNSL